MKFFNKNINKEKYIPIPNPNPILIDVFNVITQYIYLDVSITNIITNSQSINNSSTNNFNSNSNSNSDSNCDSYSFTNNDRFKFKHSNRDSFNFNNNYFSYNNHINNKGRRGYQSLTSNNDYTKESNNFSINSPIFLELQRIINNSPLDNNTQLKIEQFLNNQGYILLKNRIDQNSDINYYRINNFIIEYLKKSIVDLEKLIENYRFNVSNLTKKDNSEKVEFMLITLLSNDIIISHLLGRLLRIISNNNLFNYNTSCTELASDLGKSLVFALYSQEYQKRYGNSKDLGLSNFVKIEFSELNNLASDSVLIQIGLKLLNFLVEVDLIKSELYILAKDHKSHIYVATTKIQQDLGKSLDLLSISYKIPMIVPPKKYGYDFYKGTEILGGYLLNDKEFIIPLIIKNQELKEQSQINEINVIYDAVNNLSKVAYKINKQVLNFILDYGLEFNLILDPNFKHPLEIKKMEKNKLTLLETKNLDSYLSKKQLEMNILGLALIFKNVPEFYIPVRLDNRGRVYCMVDYLNYQSIELAKALLLFSKGEKIYKTDNKSIDYLKIFGANCYGNGVDKKSFNDRVDWINKNENDILNFRNGKLIKEADSKLLFIAFCFEYLNYHNSLFNSDSFYVSHFPIQLDATCNGYQHLSLLTGDEPLAGQLNLISGDENSIPNDFYTFVALKINDYLNIRLLEEKDKINKYSEYKNSSSTEEKENFNNILKIIESCERLLKLNKSRTLVKLPIMVKPYNASFFKMVEYVKDNFDKITMYSNNFEDLYENTVKEFNNKEKVFYLDKSNNHVKLINFDLNLFISTMEKVIYNEFPKLKEFNSYLNKVAEICSILNINITWTLPSGLNVKQYYVDSEAIRLKPFKFKKSTFSIKIKTNKINKNKQIRALMPNLIHSLDAASLCLILDMFHIQHKDVNNKINFFAIHDCFAVTANNITNLIKIIKLVYIKIYSEDSYLKKFDEGIINSIKYQFGYKSFNDETKTISVNGFNLQYPDVNQVILGKIKACKIMNSHSIIN